MITPPKKKQVLCVLILLITICSAAYADVGVLKSPPVDINKLKAIDTEGLRDFASALNKVAALHSQDPDAFREIAMKIATDPKPFPFTGSRANNVVDNIFEYLNYDQDKEIVKSFLARTGPDAAIVRDNTINLLRDHHDILKLTGSGRLNIDSDPRIIDIDFVTDRWKTASSSFSIQDLKNLVDQGFKVNIAKDGTITITPVAGEDVTARGEVKASKEGGAVKLESGSIVQGNILASIPREGKCPDCSIVINQKGQIEARGSEFPLMSPGRLLPAGTLKKGSAILGENYIQLVGGSQFQNNEGVMFTATKNTAYFDEPSKFSEYRHKWDSYIFSYIDKKAGAAELEVYAGKENDIQAAYELRSEIGYSGKDKSGKPLYEKFTYGPYKRVTIGRGEGTSMVTEWEKNAKGETAIASQFGFGNYQETTKDPKTGKTATLERRGEFFTKEGLPSTAVRIKGDPTRKILDKYLLNNNGVWEFGQCKDPKGCWAAIPAIDKILTARRVSIGEGQRMIALREGGIDTTAMPPEQAVGEYLEKVRSGIGSDESLKDRNARLAKLKAISNRLGEIHNQEIRDILASSITHEEKTAKVLEKFEEYWKHFAPGGYDGGAFITTKMIIVESLKSNNAQMRDAVTDFVISKIQPDDIDPKSINDPWAGMIPHMAAAYIQSGDSKRSEGLLKLVDMNPKGIELFRELFQENPGYAAHAVKKLTDENYIDSQEYQKIQNQMKRSIEEKLEKLDPGDPLRKQAKEVSVPISEEEYRRAMGVEDNTD